MKKDIASIFVLLLLSIIFFCKIIFIDNIFFNRDIFLYFYPFQFFACESIKDLKIPLWNPYSYSGYPFLANMQTAMFYPIRWIFYIFHLDIAYSIFLIIHIFLAGVGMYLLMRRFGLTQLSSLISAIIFSFNGYILSRIEFLSVLATYVWLPFIIFAIDLAFEKKSFKYIALTSAILSLNIFSGSPQSTFYSFIVVSIFTLYRILKFKYKFSTILILLVSFIFAFAISMVQILPFIEFLSISIRQRGLDYITASHWSLKPVYLINFFIPSFFGNIIDGTYSGSDQFWTSSFYTGIFSFIFAAIPIFYLKNNKNTILFYILFMISIILATGEYTPLYKFIYKYIPGFKMIRYPSIIIYIGVFSISILAGFGFDNIANHIKEKKTFTKIICIFFAIIIFILFLLPIVSSFKEPILKFLNNYFFKVQSFPYIFFIIKRFNVILDSLYLLLPILIICLLLITLFVKNYISGVTFGVLVITTITVDLFLYGIGINPVNNPDILKYKTRIIRFLEKEKEPFRIFVSPYTAQIFNSKYHFENNMEYNTNINSIDYVLKAKSLLFPNTNILFKIQSAEGYDPMKIEYYDRLLDSLSAQKSPSETRLLDIMNIKYILSFEKIYDKNLVHLMKDGDVNLYRNKMCLPRVFIIEKESIDFKKLGILSYFARINLYSPDKIIVETNPKKDCLLVLSDTYYPGWNVKVDGQKRNILKVYNAFRGVELKKGEKQVEFSYSPFSFKVGAFVSSVTVIFLLFVMLV